MPIKVHLSCLLVDFIQGENPGDVIAHAFLDDRLGAITSRRGINALESYLIKSLKYGIHL